MINGGRPEGNWFCQAIHYVPHAPEKLRWLKILKKNDNGILLPRLFWPTVRKKISSDLEKLLKFEAEGQEVAKFLRSLEQFIQTVKGQNNFW